ncbi:MAG: hypothetical protein Q8K65_01615 [Alphaproteobacteria bacterium]|nr:hypothetical protein [Alphaproteobacteria bacterium]
MTSPDKKAGPDTVNAGCDPACACPPAHDNNNDNKTEKPRGFLRCIFKKCAACAGSGTAGFIVGHAGCVIAPLAIAAAGVTTATAGVSALALAFGAAATAGGIYAWHRLRGKTATPFEKRIVIGSAIVGLLTSAALMQFRGHDHHGGGHDHHKDPTPHHQMHQPHDHHHHDHGAAKGINDNLSPAAAAFYARQDEEGQKRLRESAAMLRMSMGEYLNGMCITPAPAAAPAKPETPPVRVARAPDP